MLVDEVQNLPVATLEELRMLTNINSNKDELLQLILVGQPELRQLILKNELRQFAQRPGGGQTGRAGTEYQDTHSLTSSSIGSRLSSKPSIR